MKSERSWSVVRIAQRRWGAIALPPVVERFGEPYKPFGGITLDLSGPLANGFALAHPVAVELFLENGEYVASIDELNIHSFGASREQALHNLRGRIVDQHRQLQERGDRLGPGMKEIADRLSTIVVAEHA